MAIRFTDQHANSLVAPTLDRGEEILFRCRGVEKPWYAQLLWKLGSFLWKNWLVVATNRRLIFVRHGGLMSGYAAKDSMSFAWSELDRVKLGWGLFNKTFHARAPQKRMARSVALGRFWMKGNFDGAAGMERTWQRSQTLLGGPTAPNALPA